jgi:hypothetical protein
MMWQKIKLRVALALIALCAATPALAQTVYGKNCAPVAPGSDEAFITNICRTHVSCDIAYGIMSADCKVQEFSNKIADAFAAKGKLEADDVEQAAKPDGADDMTVSMRSHTTKMTAEERARRDAEDHERNLRNTNAANDGPGFRPDETVLPPTRKGGFISIFEGSGNAKDGQGTLIGEDGIAKGTFKDGKLQGEGEQILADGTYRGGNYKDGQIAGKGFEFGEKEGKTFVTEGTFKADQPDGIVTVTYEDKSSERVRWENGMLVARGPRAKAGEVPEDPKPLSDVQLALATHAPTDYVIGELQNGTGIIQRVRKDGTAQFEDWEDGHLMQVGVRAKKGDAISPQIRQKPTPHHSDGDTAPPPEEPRVAENPDPCRNERQEWASRYQGQALAEISGITPANERQMFLRQAIDTGEIDRLMVPFRASNADPMQDPDFLRKIAAIERRSVATVEQQMAGSTPQDNQTYNRLGDRAGHAWVACMAEKFGRALQAPRTNVAAAQGAQRQPTARVPRSLSYPRTGSASPYLMNMTMTDLEAGFADRIIDVCQPSLDEWARAGVEEMTGSSQIDDRARAGARYYIGNALYQLRVRLTQSDSELAAQISSVERAMAEDGPVTTQNHATVLNRRLVKCALEMLLRDRRG